MDSEEPVRIPVTDILDLHSIPARDVAGVVEEYLAEADRLGLKALRIIHGRGIGVQREIVRSILSRTPSVRDFHDAPAEAGGWGATIVTLSDSGLAAVQILYVSVFALTHSRCIVCIFTVADQ